MAKYLDLVGLSIFFGKLKPLYLSDISYANDKLTLTKGDGSTVSISLAPSITVDDTLSSSSTNPVQNKVINAALNAKANNSDLSAYLPLAGGTCTGGVSAPNFQTGTGTTNYFQCRKFRGEGDSTSYYHAIDFGYSGHDSVDFYEYDPNWNFYGCTTGKKSQAVLVGKINSNGWNGGAVLSGVPTAPTAVAGTNSTQIATTAFVKNAIPTNISSFTNDSGYLTQHQSLAGYVKSVNGTQPDISGNVNITDTRVTNTLDTTTKAYVTGTTSATTNTGTQVFDTGVYLDTTAGTLVAKRFKTSTGIEIY